MSRGEAVEAEVPRGQPAVARQLNDAISRLDARLSQISKPQPVREVQPPPVREGAPQPDAHRSRSRCASRRCRSGCSRSD